MKLALLIVVALGLSATAEARPRDKYRPDYRPNSGWDDRYDRWENRRDARRAGVVAGVIAGNVARGAAVSSANAHYQECMMQWGYDQACEARYYEERRDARRTGNAVGITAGVITRDIVRK